MSLGATRPGAAGPSLAFAALLLFATVSGCSREPAEDGPPGGPDALPGADSGATPAELPGAPPAAADTFRRLEFAVPAWSPGRERGVGIVFPPGDPGSAKADTLVVRSRPQPDAPVAARLIRGADGVYALEVRGAVAEGGALEHGYEEVGFPLLELPGAGGASPAGSAASGWLRVHYGVAQEGAPLEGWIRDDPARVSRLLWSEHLALVPLFFLHPDSVGFFAAPEGARVPVSLEPGPGDPRYDYIMYPLETRGSWMRVEVATPSTYCFDPPAPRRDTVWVRYLNEGGRPRVWYYTRGC